MKSFVSSALYLLGPYNAYKICCQIQSKLPNACIVRRSSVLSQYHNCTIFHRKFGSTDELQATSLKSTMTGMMTWSIGINETNVGLLFQSLCINQQVALNVTLPFKGLTKPLVEFKKNISEPFEVILPYGIKKLKSQWYGISKDTYSLVRL
jgi:hypothetical protein